MLAAMFGLGLGAMMGDSAIVDEIAHIPAGYSYLHYGDYRLNPEHPPLIKDLAGLPLQFMHLRFPDYEPAWTTDANGQWESGWNFIYHIGNNADAILFWARLPILLLAIGFGAWLFWYVRKEWGLGVALLTLLFYTMSPNIIAHAHYVTTDLGESVFAFVALVTFAKFVKRPTGRNVLWLSLALAGANLAKFSGFLLYPFLGVLTIGMVVLWRDPASWVTRLKHWVGGFIAASVASLGWIWLFYIPHTWNMPESVQDKLINTSLMGSSVGQTMAHILTAINGLPLMKSLAQYLLGLTMVFGRVSGGNTTYFNGQVTNQSFHGYFPELFLVKTQVALLILLILVVGAGLAVYLSRRPFRLLKPVLESTRKHTTEWVLGGFAVFYFGISVAGNLNLGIRHILPIYVPIFVLVAIGVVQIARRMAKTPWQTHSAVLLTLLLGWYTASTVLVYPAFTAYFNELIGGAAYSGEYFSDSSVDWGQDLKRLKTYLAEHPEIDHLALDYFGGGDPKYYFCKRQYDKQGRLVATAGGYDCSAAVYEDWHSEYGPYTGQYIAVSETFLENDRYYSNRDGLPGYRYLRAMQPVAKIGYSIYLYKLY